MKNKTEKKKIVKNEIIISPELKENDFEEALDLAQRRKRALTMRKFKSKIAAARKRMSRRPADKERLLKRADKAARNTVKKQIIGKSGKSYSDMSPSEKGMIDKRVEKRKALINRLSKKLLPQVRMKDRAKISGSKSSTNESYLVDITEKELLNIIREGIDNYGSPLFQGSDELAKKYKEDTPGELEEKVQLMFKRNEMPQIPKENYQEFLSFARKNGVKVTHKIVDTNKLRSLQADFSPKIVKNIVTDIKADNYDDSRPILISSDNYVIDGNHRWLAHKELRKSMKATVFDIKAEDLLNLAKKFPKVKFYKRVDQVSTDIKEDYRFFFMKKPAI